MDDSLLRDACPPEEDVVPDRIRENKHFLGNVADVLPELLQRNIADVRAVDENGSPPSFVQPGKEVKERGFS